MVSDVDVITTGRPDLTAYAAERGYLVGARLDKLPEYDGHDISINFIDMHWEDPQPDALVDAAADHEPAYVVAGDYLRDEDNISRVNERAERLREHAEHVIVVPKQDDDITHVPDWCIVGYSVPTQYGGTDIPVWEYQTTERDLHLLGGTPHKQLDLLKTFGQQVVSMDSNSHHKAATIGAKAWHAESPHWRKVEAGEDAVERAYRRAVDNLHGAHRARGIL